MTPITNLRLEARRPTFSLYLMAYLFRDLEAGHPP